jgi:hypothetical protein
MKFGNLNFLKPSGPSQAYNGTALPLPLPVPIKCPFFSVSRFMNKNFSFDIKGLWAAKEKSAERVLPTPISLSSQ